MSQSTLSFLKGGGEMGQLIRSCNWLKTPVGGLEQWPQSLRTATDILLHSRCPMFLFWGNELTCFFNDAYCSSLENVRNPSDILGKPAAAAHPEIWPVAAPFISKIMAGEEAEWYGDQPMRVGSNHETEDCYFSISLSAVQGENGQPAGVFATCTQSAIGGSAAVAAVQESKNQLAFAIEANELGTFDYNPFTNKFTANDRLKNWFGLPPQAEINLSIATDAIAAADRERVQQLIKAALQYNSGGRYDTQYTIVHPLTGTERIVEAKGKAWFNTEKTAYRLNGTLQDITEQVTDRRKLQESETRFRKLIEEAPVATCLFMGWELKIEVANEAMIQFWGKGRSVIGQPLARALPELNGQPFLKILDDIFTTGKDFTGQAVPVQLVVNNVSATYYFDFTYRPLFNEAGEVYAIMDMAIDVTEQVLAHQKLEEAEQRARLSVEAGELGTYEVNLLTNEIITSPRFDAIFDITHNHEWRRYVESIHPEDMAIRNEAFKQSAETGIIDYSVRTLKTSGNIHWVRVRGRFHNGPDGKPLRLLGVVQDITEQVELQRQKDSFLGIASHELKTPVTSIKAYAQLMEKMFARSGDTRNAAIAAKMDNQANRLSSLIADLLDVTKINNGRLQFNLDTFDFNEMVEEVIEDMQRTAPDHIIKKKLDFTGTVYADRERISQVLINLVSNAIKYSPDREHIVIYTQNLGSEVQLCVQDFGIGISSEKKDKVFEQFYRVSGSLEHTFPGLGLGLYISSEIIKRMNGRIWVNSTEGKGSTFCFAIAIKQE